MYLKDIKKQNNSRYTPEKSPYSLNEDICNRGFAQPANPQVASSRCEFELSTCYAGPLQNDPQQLGGSPGFDAQSV